MTSAIFKSTGAIIIYSILTIGILAIVGYNFWGWFGGSKKWKEGPGGLGGDNQPKEGERCTIAGVEGTYQKYGIDGLQCVPNAETNQRTMTTDQSFANTGTAPEPSSERKASTIPKQKSMDWHGQGGWIDGNKTLTFIGYKPSIFAIGETVNVDFRLTPTSPVVKTITAKVIAIPSSTKSFIVIDSPHETIYNNAYGRVYN